MSDFAFPAIAASIRHMKPPSSRFSEISDDSARGWRRLLLLLMLLCCSAAQATPDRRLEVDEVLLGVNDKGFVSLRTERDNLCSYYRSRTKRYLDEYLKVQAGEKDQVPRQNPAKSTLLLDVTYSRDPNDQSAHPAITETVNARDDSVALAKVLSEYPEQPWKWDAERRQRLVTSQRAGVSLGKQLDVVWGGFVTEKLFGERNTEQDWVLEEVYEDQNTLFLRVATPRQEDEKQSRFLSVPLRKTQQLKDHLSKHEVYLSAGSFLTEKQAVGKALEIAAERIRMDVPGPVPEVWTMRTSADKLAYVVAVCPLEQADTAEKFARLEGLLSVSLAPQASRDFQERIPLPSPPAPKAGPEKPSGKAE